MPIQRNRDDNQQAGLDILILQGERPAALMNLLDFFVRDAAMIAAGLIATSSKAILLRCTLSPNGKI